MTVRRGMTFLEVTIAIVMLTLVTGMVTGGLGFMETTGARSMHRVNAMEVAHRVILQYVEDKDELEREIAANSDGAIYPMGRFFYRFVYRVDLLPAENLADNDEEKRRSRSRTIISEATLTDRLRQQLHEITVEVYLAQPGTRAVSGAPLARLTRIFSISQGPVAYPYRTLDRVLDMVDEQDQREIEERRKRRDEQEKESKSN